ncbi:MAG: signal peptidase I [Oscillospiraceae bacterium]|nr:signal peptidase I [Oscillospiraceae bacterium]
MAEMTEETSAPAGSVTGAEAAAEEHTGGHTGGHTGEEKAAAGTAAAKDGAAADGSSPSSSEKPKGRKKKKRSALWYAVSFFAKIGLTVIAVWALLRFVGGVFMCHDNSAFPMIKDGDLVITYRLDPIRQGDVVVYRHGGTVHFGRVCAVAGDKVELGGSIVTVNGYGLYEDTVYPTSAEGAEISFPYTVPDGCVFVLNDYRSDLSDSRSYGGIPLEDTEGKAIFIVRRRGI